VEEGYGGGYPTQWKNVLLTGTSNPHVDLGQLLPGVANGFLFSSGEVVLRVSSTSNYYTVSYQTFSFPIPNNASLIGVSFWQQVASYQTAKVWFGLGLSRGGHAVIGT